MGHNSDLMATRVGTQQERGLRLFLRLLIRLRKLNLGLNLFSYIVFFQLGLVAKGTHFKNLPGVGLAPLGNLRY